MRGKHVTATELAVPQAFSHVSWQSTVTSIPLSAHSSIRSKHQQMNHNSLVYVLNASSDITEAHTPYLH
jgi:hypothetical protein